MVDEIGRSDLVHFKNFKSYYFTLYTTLWKSANLILNLNNQHKYSGYQEQARYTVLKV